AVPRCEADKDRHAARASEARDCGNAVARCEANKGRDAVARCKADNGRDVGASETEHRDHPTSSDEARYWRATYRRTTHDGRETGRPCCGETNDRSDARPRGHGQAAGSAARGEANAKIRRRYKPKRQMRLPRLHLSLGQPWRAEWPG